MNPVYVDPYAQGTPGDYWQQGPLDQCCRIICWILVALFVIGLIVWLVRWITRPSYPAYVIARHNLVDIMNHAKNLRAYMNQ